MASAINNPPNEYDFGLEFNYALWTKDTVVTMHNVQWNNDYRDVVRFDDGDALNTYLDGLESSSLRIENVSYLKPGVPIRLQIPFNAAYRYNYLRASNFLQPISGGDVRKDFYYFITDVRYIAPDTTELVVQLDVWQTFIYDVSIGNSYVERGHIAIANSNSFNNYGRDYLTIPEGIDIGSDYTIAQTRTQQIMQLGQRLTADSPEGAVDGVHVLVFSTTDLVNSGGTESAPILKSAVGSMIQGVPSGASAYLFFTLSDFTTWLSNNSNKPWATQGIISATLIPPIIRYDPSFHYGGNGTDNLFTFSMPTSDMKKTYGMFTAWRTTIVNQIPSRYRALKKFLTYPYMAVELTAFNGTPIVLKPENWNDPDATVDERAIIVAPDQRINISPHRYNYLPTSVIDANMPADDGGEFLDFATIVTNFPTLMVINDGTSAYLAANRNQIAFQYTDAAWSQQRALRGNEVSYDQASSGMNLANELTSTGIAADTQQTALNNYTAQGQAVLGAVGSVAGGVLGGAGGLAGGGPGAAVGAATGLAGGALQAAMGMSALAWQQNQNTQSLGIRNAAANRGNAARQGNMGYVRDTNKNLADFAANGDYENRIAGINAKVQDAKLIQPTTSGQVGGDAFNLINNAFAVSMRIKLIDPANIRVVGEYWLRYGYAVRKFLTPPASLHTMTKFTYWKFLETYIVSAPMPESFKQAIRGILEKGVTVWTDPTYIGVTDIADNAPLAGVSF